MMNALQSMNIGMPPSKKKKTHRGRKPSTKPGAQHLAALTQAHGAGNLQGAKTAALSYANAVHKHMTGMASMTEPDADETGGPPDLDADDTTPPTPPAPKAPSMARQAMMARLKR